MKRAAPFLLLFATSCLDDGGGSSGPPELVTWTATCTSDAVEVVVEVSTGGAGSVTVEFGDKNGTIETHELIDDGYSRRDDVYVWYADLDVVSSAAAQEDSVSTRYDCDPGTWAWRVIAWDTEDFQSDCIIEDITGVGTFDEEGCW